MAEYETDLAAVYAAEGETVTVAGTAVSAFWNTGYGEALGVAGSDIALRCVASHVSHAAVGDAVVRGPASYTIRGIEAIFPDGLETLLVLERA
jgi:hypothetical protein